MHFKAIVSTVVLIATIQLAVAKLEHGKGYTIQNAQDKTYLMAAKDGQLCKKRGDVITTTVRNPSEKAQEWGYRENTKEGWQFLLNGYFNEITFVSKKLCSIDLNIFKISQINGDGYTIENTETKKCLKSGGSGKRITWDECVHKSADHYWKFVEVGK